jgi:hypothetical protein
VERPPDGIADDVAGRTTLTSTTTDPPSKSGRNGHFAMPTDLTTPVLDKALGNLYELEWGVPSTFRLSS